MKKVLIIAYYWPPSGGAGVQRWLKFAKYLPEYGYEPHIIVPKNPNYPSHDSSFETDIPIQAKIIELPIWEPYNIYRKFMGLPKEHKINHTFSHGKATSNWKSNLSLWLKTNLFIPDPRVFWIFNAVPFVKTYVQANQINTIITTSPPHSIQLIGYLIKKLLPSINWIADYRDPWTTIYYADSLPQNFFSKKLNSFLERICLKNAERIITVSPSLAEELESISHRKVEVITNGFDPDDFTFSNTITFERFKLAYIGTLYKEYNMPAFWVVLSELCAENPEFKKDFKLTLAGSIDQSILKKMDELGLSSNISNLGYVDHNQVSDLINESHVLLITTPQKNNQGILTGKIFEYLSSRKPIFCVTSKDNDLWKLISKSRSGVCADYDDGIRIKSELLKYYELFKHRSIPFNEEHEIEIYSRKNLTKKLSELIQSLEN
jgi:glycosyltransferase involved in cell wall biosynthesis